MQEDEKDITITLFNNKDQELGSSSLKIVSMPKGTKTQNKLLLIYKSAADGKGSLP